MTLMLFIANMSSLVFQLVTMTLKLSRAKLARESFDALVFILVHLEGSSGPECLGTFVTLERSFIAMNILMRCKLMFGPIDWI